jgi:hypothetical protein
LDPDWTAWRKDPGLVSTPEQPSVNVVRDRKFFFDAGSWRMVVGAGYPDGRAPVRCSLRPRIRSMIKEH